MVTGGYLSSLLSLLGSNFASGSRLLTAEELLQPYENDKGINRRLKANIYQ